MHPFARLTDLPAFQGNIITSLSFGPFQLDLCIGSTAGTRDSNVIHICIEHLVEHREADGTLWHYNCQTAVRPPVVLHRLVSKEIVDVRREDLRLVLQMEDGASLTVISDLGPYESGQITWEQKYLVF